MRPDLEYFQLLAEARGSGSADRHKKIKLAVLADCASQHLSPLLRALFRRRGIDVEIYEGAFGGIEFEVRNPGSPLYAFDPDVILILNSVQYLRDDFYSRGDSPGFDEEFLNRITSAWDSIRANSTATVIQSTFATPLERFFGNYDRRVDSSLSSLVSRLNSSIVSESANRQGVLLLDLDSLASWVGLGSWFDERLWAIGKALCSLEHLPLVAQNLVDIVLATQGHGIKCVVVDLDNTLWGGVVGDDGPHGVCIAAHGAGESYFRLQCFLRQLKRRGILLAVCSKNERAAAAKPFAENSEMVLRLEDFAAFVANWENKPDNIKALRQTLNIGLDSILFLDDNPFEREAVRAILPDVIVPELPDDPSDWVKHLAELNLFETTSFSAEDQQRSDLYSREAQRRAIAETAPDFDSFLESLEMTIEVGRFTPEHITRIVQLLQRSNQFNLTTRRHSEPECIAMMNDVDGCLPLYAKLKDRFGDHGLIGVVVLRPDRNHNILVISDWLMSCRVLARAVEEYLMNYVLEQAREMGSETICATYIPTPKNEMVRDFYGRFGFTKTVEEPNGTIHWTIETSRYQPRKTFILPDAQSVGMATA